MKDKLQLLLGTNKLSEQSVKGKNFSLRCLEFENSVIEVTVSETEIKDLALES